MWVGNSSKANHGCVLMHQVIAGSQLRATVQPLAQARRITVDSSKHNSMLFITTLYSYPYRRGLLCCV
jgi:hypothetical protein